MTESFYIPQRNFDALASKIHRLFGDLHEHAAPPLQMVTLGEKTEERLLSAPAQSKSESMAIIPPVRLFRVWHEVAINGADLVIGGLDLAGVAVKRRNTGRIAVKPFTGLTPSAEQMARERQCSHCLAAHSDKYAAILRSRSTGQFFTVGRSCLGDFLGNAASPLLLRSIDAIAEARAIACEAQEPAWDGGLGPEEQIETVFALSVCNRILAENGWLSANGARRNGGSATWQRLLDAITLIVADPDAAAAAGVYPGVEDYLCAKKAAEWIAKAAQDRSDPYLRNVAEAAADRIVKPSSWGLLPVLMQSWCRSLAQRSNFEAASSSHIGSI